VLIEEERILFALVEANRYNTEDVLLVIIECICDGTDGAIWFNMHKGTSELLRVEFRNFEDEGVLVQRVNFLVDVCLEMRHHAINDLFVTSFFSEKSLIKQFLEVFFRVLKH